MARLKCPSCDCKFKVEEDETDPIVHCPECGKRVRVPAQEEERSERTRGERAEKTRATRGTQKRQSIWRMARSPRGDAIFFWVVVGIGACFLLGLFIAMFNRAFTYPLFMLAALCMTGGAIWARNVVEEDEGALALACLYFVPSVLLFGFKDLERFGRQMVLVGMGLFMLLPISCVKWIGPSFRSKPARQVTIKDPEPGKSPAPFPLAAPAFKQPPVRPTSLNGLKAYWPFDEGQGTQIGDESGNRLHGTLTGGQWVQGVQGSAVWLEGEGHFIDLGTNASLNVDQGQSFAVTGWIATKGANLTVLSFRNLTKGAPVLHVTLLNGLEGVVRGDSHESGEAIVSLRSGIADGKWHHFAVVRNTQGQISLYVDGVHKGHSKGANSSGPITTNSRTLGYDRFSQNYGRRPFETPFFVGALDDFCFFDRELSSEEVRALAGTQ